MLALLRLLAERPNVRAWISLACGSSSTLNSGESIADVVADIERLDTLGQVEAVGVNCTPPQFVAGILDQMRSVTRRALVVYPNSGESWDATARTWHTTDVPLHHRFGPHLVQQWLQKGARVVGGCCRVSPVDIARVSTMLHNPDVPAVILRASCDGAGDNLSLIHI